MDKIDLEVLVKLVETKSISKVSKTLPLSYSAINARLLNLENEVGVPLFGRTRKGTELTNAGRKFYYFAYKSLLALEVGIGVARTDEKKKYREEIFRVGVTRPLSHIVVPIFTKLMREKERFGRWQIQTGDSLDLLMLTNGEALHMSVINQNEYIPEGLEQLLLFEEPIHLIGPLGQKLPNYNDFFHVLERIPLILLKGGFPLRELIEKEIFKPVGYVPHQLIEVDTIDVIKEMVRQGVGYSFLPMSSLWNDNNIMIYPSLSPHMTQKFSLIYSPSFLDSHGQLFQHLSEGIKEQVKIYRKESKQVEKYVMY
ncbi:LysR family transcriptional regulator [Halalkalibacterium ligniniphilum]|uniref:LysR family transcriptional regulator n=1 Tax=Halalkalibacterium ligniniphilum TaxID=1134413 RepID=UPI00034881DB|nr:LysR family transcriptional regulator [Halalkalibacterium ligniniphilum]